MKRRTFLNSALNTVASGAAGLGLINNTAQAQSATSAGLSDRNFMVELLLKIATPILSNMAKGNLKNAFKPEVSPSWDGRNKNVAYLEAFGRLMAGVASWLGLPNDDSAEGKIRQHLTQNALQSLTHAVTPNSPDYLLWQGERQALVDCAYLTNALIRAPKQLWQPLEPTTQQRLIKEIKSLRATKVHNNNWLLFAAMNEAFLLSVGEQWNSQPIELALNKMADWYAGDGWVADGEKFHFDYYNSYVIYPMLIEIIEVLVRTNINISNFIPRELVARWVPRMQRYCEYLERFISPSGTYPPFGRSITYRTAAFQPLALLALQKRLPSNLPEGQIRAAMTAVHQAVFSNATNFTDAGFLTIGFVGHQPDLGDWYSNSGSMYITSASFLPLGLAAKDSYWQSPALPWTQKKAFTGASFPRNYAIDN